MAGNDAAASLGVALAPMLLQLSSGDFSGHLGGMGVGLSVGIDSAYRGDADGGGLGFLPWLSLEQGKGEFMKIDNTSRSGKSFRDDAVDSRAASSVKAKIPLKSFLLQFAISFI